MIISQSENQDSFETDDESMAEVDSECPPYDKQTDKVIQCNFL